MRQSIVLQRDALHVPAPPRRWSIPPYAAYLRTEMLMSSNSINSRKIVGATLQVLTTVVLTVASGAPAFAMEKSNPSCGLRSKNPQGYDFCAQLTDQASPNPVVAAQTPYARSFLTPPQLKKPEGNYVRCVETMKSKQHMRAADASAYCMQLFAP